jgi:outer membrane protein assembly factor BamB
MSRYHLLLFLMLMILLTTTGCEALSAQFQSPSERFRLEGDRLLAEERTAEAILSYRAAVDNDRTNLGAVTQLANLYRQQGRSRLALRMYQIAAHLAPQGSRTQDGIQDTIRGLSEESPTTLPIKLGWATFLGESEPIGFSLNANRLHVTLNDGTVLALDAASGTILWQVKLPDRATATPIVNGSQLWVGAQDGALYTLSSADGGLLWKFASKAPIYAPPAFNEQTVYLSSGDGTFYALDRASGALKWNFTSGAALHAQPILANGVVYFGSNDGHLYALDAASGKPFWANGILTQGAVESPAVIDGGRVFFGSGDTRLYALDAASGGEYWRYSTPDAVYAAPLLAGDRLYAASAGNTLTALDPLSGKQLWEVKVSSALPYPPVLSNGRLLFVASGSPNLFAVDAQTGAPLFAADSGDWLAAGPLLSEDSLFLLGKDGTLLSYEMK